MMRETGFTVAGVDLALAPGWKKPGLPAWRIVRVSDGAHVSLAYPESEEAVLFDMAAAPDGLRLGYRLHLGADPATVEALSKGEYWKAREAIGYGFRKRRAVTA